MPRARRPVRGSVRGPAADLGQCERLAQDRQRPARAVAGSGHRRLGGEQRRRLRRHRHVRDGDDGHSASSRPKPRPASIFWYEDVNNFYVFEIAPNGKASVWRRQRGKWLAQVDWQDAANANKGDGASTSSASRPSAATRPSTSTAPSSGSSPVRRRTTASRSASSPARPIRPPRSSPSTT